MNSYFYNKLAEAVADSRICTDEPMSNHTTFCIGGPADFLVYPRDVRALREGIRFCRQEGVPFFITGNGSNLLVGDGGYRGVIFKICRTLDDIREREEKDEAGLGHLFAEAGAGVMLSVFAHRICSLGYTGAEFMTGIPGTLGGAVTMNAGAYKRETADNILWAQVMDPEGNEQQLSKEDLHMGYRTSAVMKQDLIVLRAAFSFEQGDPGQIREKVRELTQARREKQPLEYPSAGSTFKRPEGLFAGKLIEDSGLKGYSIGSAQVSEKHAGFLINRGGASAAQMRSLITHVQKTVYDRFGVRLEPEVRFLGEF